MSCLPRLHAPPERSVQSRIRLRYEDIAQDGRAKLTMIPASLGTVWMARQEAAPEAKVFVREGIVPVLRRLVLEGTDTPIAVQHPLSTDGRWETARVVTGDRTRFLMNMRVDLSGPRGLTNGPPPERAGEQAPVGGVFAEHVLTRLFAPKEKRRVDRLPDGVAEVPDRDWVELDSVLRTHAERVDDAPVGSGEVRFGLVHTDSNQHVNSLVYPRLFEEHAVAAWGEGLRLMRAAEVIWRKPSFAGERVSVRVQRIRDGERLGAITTLAADGEAQPRCVAKLWLG